LESYANGSAARAVITGIESQAQIPLDTLPAMIDTLIALPRGGCHVFDLLNLNPPLVYSGGFLFVW